MTMVVMVVRSRYCRSLRRRWWRRRWNSWRHWMRVGKLLLWLLLLLLWMVVVVVMMMMMRRLLLALLLPVDGRRREAQGHILWKDVAVVRE